MEYVSKLNDIEAKKKVDYMENVNMTDCIGRQATFVLMESFCFEGACIYVLRVSFSSPRI